MLKHIILSSGDAALVVNGQIIMTADPQFEDPAVVEDVAEKLAAALEHPLQRIERPEPDDEDWNWDDVLEESDSGVRDVVDDVLRRAEKYGFQPDEDMVRDAVEESANLLNIELSEEQIVQACDRVTQLQLQAQETQDTASERQPG